MTVSTPPKRLTLALSLVLTCVVGAIPPGVIFVDRWLRNERVHNFLRDWWCEEKSRCDLLVPYYFVLILILVFAVILLVGLIGSERIDRDGLVSVQADESGVPRRQKLAGLVLLALSLLGVVVTIVWLSIAPQVVGWVYLPICLAYVLGWFLITTPLARVIPFLSQRASLGLVYLLGVAALTWLLFSYYGRNQLSIFSLVLAAVAILVLVRQRKKIVWWYWLVLVGLVLYTLQLNAWNFSVVGDANIFQLWARDIAFKRSLIEIGNRFFDGTAVYGTHPYLSSLLQAPTVRLLDDQNFGWRLSSIAASLLSIYFFSFFFCTFLTKWFAGFAAFLLAVSHYLMTFSRIGYNNTQALLAMGMAFAAATWAIRSGKRWAFVVTGLALAFCFYTFPGALYLVPIVLWYLFLYRLSPWRSNWAGWGILLLTLLVFIVPLLFQLDYWTTKLLGTPFWSADVVPSGWLWAQRIGIQILYVAESFLYVAKETHHLRLAYVDSITAVVVLVGLGVLVERVRSDKFALMVLSVLGLFALVGATGGADAPPNTRMILLVPWWGLIAAIGLQWFVFRLRDLGWQPRMGYAVAAVLLALILGLNLYLAYDYSVRPAAGYLEFDSLLLRVGQNLEASPAAFPKAILLVYNGQAHSVPALQESFRLGYVHTTIKPFRVTGMPRKFPRALLDHNMVVVISPQLPQQVQTAYNDFFTGRGYLACLLVPDSGAKPLQVWRRANAADPCAPQQLWQPIHLPDPIATTVIALGLTTGLGGLVYTERRAHFKTTTIRTA